MLAYPHEVPEETATKIQAAASRVRAARTGGATDQVADGTIRGQAGGTSQSQAGCSRTLRQATPSGAAPRSRSGGASIRRTYAGIIATARRHQPKHKSDDDGKPHPPSRPAQPVSEGVGAVEFLEQPVNARRCQRAERECFEPDDDHAGSLARGQWCREQRTGVIPHMGSDTGQGFVSCRFPFVSVRFPFPCLG